MRMHPAHQALYELWLLIVRIPLIVVSKKEWWLKSSKEITLGFAVIRSGIAEHDSDIVEITFIEVSKRTVR